MITRLMTWIETNDDRFFAFCILIYLLCLAFGG